MTDAEALSRIEALETRISHQERTIEVLNTSVTEQWEQIDRLTKQVGRMADRLQQVEASAPSSDALEPPPPHY
jgi:SlyX protein